MIKNKPKYTIRVYQKAKKGRRSAANRKNAKVV